MGSEWSSSLRKGTWWPHCGMHFWDTHSQQHPQGGGGRGDYSMAQ